MTKEKDYVFVFINQLFYGKIKWPITECRCPKPKMLQTRIIDQEGIVKFLDTVEPERISGFSSTSVTEGSMYVMSIGLRSELTLVDEIRADGANLDIVIRKEKA